jgi:signal transduction histidine kinase
MIPPSVPVPPPGQAREPERSLALLEAITADLAGALTIETVCELVMARLYDLLGATTGAIYYAQGDPSELRLAAGRGLSAAPLERLSRIPLDSPQPVAAAVRTRRSLWEENHQALLADFPNLKEASLPPTARQAVIALPLLVDTRALGGMMFGFGEPRRFSAADRRLLETVASQCGQALERARLYAAEQATRAEPRAKAIRQETAANGERRTEQLRGLADAAVLINNASGTEAILNAITERARLIIGAHQAVTSMAMDCKGSQSINAVSLSGKYAGWRGHAEWMEGRGMFAEVCRTNRPLRLRQAELETHPAWQGQGGERERYPPLRGWLAAPLVGRDGRNIGVIQLSDRMEGEFTALDEDILVQLAQMASAAVENARLLEVVQREKQRAEEASRAKDEFLAMLGHELRNPLSPILTALELARMRENSGLAKERTIIERQVQHLVRLVDDLLDVSRITRGKIELKRRPVRLADVVAHAIEMTSPLLEERRHRLRVTVPRRGLIVDGDEHRLAQVVSNLLTNAAKYTDPGGRIEITGGREGEEAVLRVRDSGIGINPELVPHVFDLFVQSKRAIDRAQGGLGLGLTIVRSLVELHGGAVSAASEGTSRGSTFTVRLPLSAVADARAEAAAERPGAEGEGPRTKRILVVDDNRDAAELMAEALAASGHETRVAFDGPEALEVAAAFAPEVALLDIGLPVMDGYELARRLREHSGGDRLRLVAVTGYGQSKDRERSRAAGFDEHLVKPVDLDHLEKVIDRLAPP